MKYLVTGTAGFIGFHLARALLAEGHQVFGIDGLTPYYDLQLKLRRQDILLEQSGFSAETLMLEDNAALTAVMARVRPDVVVHLAGQAGVRYSIDNPRAYIESNVLGTFNLFEQVRALSTPHVMLASTSSVYGAGEQIPFREDGDTDHPLTIYAATKKATEVIAHSYAHLFALPTTVFRFFTVYGPWGRPDMAPYRFVDSIVHGRPIDVYNHGRMARDFTYVADLVEAVVRLSRLPPQAPAHRDDQVALHLASPVAPYRVVNIGNNQPVALLDFISAVETALGRTAVRNMLPMQLGDVPQTWADTTQLEALTGFRPSTPLADGVAKFVAWYRDYHGA